MTDAKIAIVGAGSGIFSLTLVRDLAVTKGLSGCTLCLMDVDEARLGAVSAFATKYMQATGSKIKVERTTKREEAMRGADFVVNTALAGGHQEQELMRGVGEKHGYYRGLDAVDFNMVSDYYTIQGYKQLRLMVDIAKDAKDIAPEAWFLEVANPILEGCTLIHRLVGKKRLLGFCDGPTDVLELIQALGLGVDDTEFQMAGLNHTIFLTSLLSGGKDAYPLIDGWVRDKGPKVWEAFDSEMDFEMCRAAADMYRVYGLYPIGDTVRSGGWKYHYDLETKKYWYGKNGGFDSELGWGSYLKRVEGRTNLVLALARKTPDEILAEFPPELSLDPIVPFIDAVATGNKKRLVINIPNDGVIDGLRNDLVVEVPCTVDGAGFHPERPGALPKGLMNSAIYPRTLRMEWVLEAFASGSKDALLDVILRDRRTTSERQAVDALDAVLSLPFNESMKKHYS